MQNRLTRVAIGLVLVGLLEFLRVGAAGTPAKSEPPQLSPTAPNESLSPRSPSSRTDALFEENVAFWAPDPSGTTEILSAVWGQNDEFVVVGSNGTILHYDGTLWQPMNSGTTVDLQGVWGHSLTDIFAVGPDGTIIRHSGSAWLQMQTPTTEFLRGVWGTSPSDVFVTGTRGTIIHYDGIHWQSMESNNPNRLYDIWGSSNTDIFVVGHLATVLHFDGSTWTTMDSGARTTLWGVWGDSTGYVFAVGGGGVIVRYDGSDWSQMISGTTETLLRVWGTSTDNVFAVGGNGTILQYDGSAWRATNSGTSHTLKDVYGTSETTILAVGENGTILRYFGDDVPVFLQDFRVNALPDAASIVWQISGDAQVRGFRIHKRWPDGTLSSIPSPTTLIHPTQRTYLDDNLTVGGVYHYALAIHALDGFATRSPWIGVAIPLYPLILHQNAPNPFNPETRVEFFLPVRSSVNLAVFEVSGRHVVTLINEVLPAGHHFVDWNGRNATGHPVATGVYICRLRAGKSQLSTKMTLAK
ncbi:MAG: hypothetical protein JSW58_10880 [Candidatus Latescibacterota bacterium]|nr:MAG: hypothetical protein JSW58_10880 [Candidatus Latescibacterota bacterium]